MRLLTSVFLATCALASAAQTTAPAHLHVTIIMPASATSGRLLVFATRQSSDTPPVLAVSPFSPSDVYVAAQEVQPSQAGQRISVDVDQLAFPAALSTLPPGKYVVQALLDVDHSYDYNGDDPTDWISPVTPVEFPLKENVVALTLDHHPEPPRYAAFAKSVLKPGEIEPFSVLSKKLTTFAGHNTFVTGAVVLPPGYDAKAATTYPTVYWTHGFSGSSASSILTGATIRKRMIAGTMPAMIWVMLDENIHTGTHEFADSANNGPWGEALTTEAIPTLERQYRMDARVNGRFLNGHSSGGWATLQLQVNYPHVFGGTWSTSPDPSDFHDFTGVDLYAPHANMFRRADGTSYPLVRRDGKVVATIEQFSRLEEVLGTEGGQLNSFDWVFSPRGANGRPVPMYDRATGNIDPRVVQYWHDHYDLAAIVQKRWPQDGPALKGKIHVYVGTADTFYLDGPAHRFDAVLQSLGADAQFHFLPGRSHFDLYLDGKDRGALYDDIAKQMYVVARPAK